MTYNVLKKTLNPITKNKQTAIALLDIYNAYCSKHKEMSTSWSWKVFYGQVSRRKDFYCLHIFVLFPFSGAEPLPGSVSLPTTPTGSGDCIVFHGVTYLGCATVNAPRSEVEIYRNMAVLNEQTQGSIPIVLSVPATADGTVR